MLLDPYLTTIAQASPVKKLVAAVVAEAIHRQYRGNVMTIQDEDKDVPGFNQPLLVTLPAARIPIVAIDYRPFAGSNGYMVEQRDVMRLRAMLTLHAARVGTTGDFYQPAAQAAYASLIAGIVAGKFGIDSTLKTYITTVAAAHYYNMTHEGVADAAYDDSLVLQLTGQIVKMFHFPADVVDGVLRKMTFGDTLMSLMNNIKLVDGTDRTASLTPGLILNAATGSGGGGTSGMWIGVAASETLAVGFEHAPTFCAMLYAALGEGTYSRGEIAKRLKYVGAVQKGTENFRNTMRHIQSELEDHDI